MLFSSPLMRPLLTIFLLPAAIGLAAQQPAATQRPNIVIIMADDMGFSDLGCYGSEIATPNVDRLAAGGLRFTQFYNTSRCCPTRASLLTGLYPHQAGVGHMVGDYGVPSYQGYLSDRSVTIAEVLRPAGYRTLMTGKWHVGERRPHWPLDRGFEHFYGLTTGGTNYFDITKGKSPNTKRTMAIDNEPIIPEPGTFYITDAITNHAVRMIDSYGRQDTPFFLYVAYTAPHWPLHAWPEDIAKYRGKYMKGWDALRKERHQRMIEMGLIDARWPMTPRDAEAPAWADVEDKDGMDLRMSVYAAQIDRMDQGIGRIVTQIRKIGAEDNTLVLFLSDNGGCHEGGPLGFDRRNNGVPCGGVDSYMSYGLSWANASNTPFRRYKHWVHEGGIATPLIAYWPAVIKKGGQLTREVGHVIDLMATCVDVAGTTYPDRYKGKSIKPLEGKSLLPIFREGERQDHEVIYWEHSGNRALRQGDWKIVSASETKDWELYDLAADRTELNNLAAKHPEKLEELTALYDGWAKQCGVLTRGEISEIRRKYKENKRPKR